MIDNLKEYSRLTLGNEELISEELLGVCGSIYPSEYGLKYTADFVKAQKKTLVVMYAKGISMQTIVTSLVHKKPIVVVVKDEELINPGIVNSIVQYGGLIIYLENETNPLITCFEFIDQLISEMCIIELAMSSSLMYLVDILNNNNKEIYALPGSVYSNNSLGTNMLISEGASILYLGLEI